MTDVQSQINTAYAVSDNDENISSQTSIKQIKTNLKNKQDVFKMLALAQVTRSNLLLLGQPGVAKTESVIDYINALYNSAKTFILEINNGTRERDIIGKPDIKKFLETNTYEIVSSITEANAIVLNEIDKGDIRVRNCLLGIMRERKIYEGTTSRDCIYDILVATCNEIPEDEIKSPFWDRFILRYTVSRIDIQQLIEYFNEGGKDFTQTIDIRIPTEKEIDAVQLLPKDLEAFYEVAYDHLSDRTLVAIPNIVKAISLIWDCSIVSALIHTATLMINSQAAERIQLKINPQSLNDIYNEIAILKKLSNTDLKIAVVSLKQKIEKAYTEKEFNDEQYQKLGNDLRTVILEHKNRIKNNKEETHIDIETGV